MSFSEFASQSENSINVYEERLDDENTVDLSSKGLEEVPEIYKLTTVVIYLQNNKLSTLPDDFFPSLQCLMYLDLRDNRLIEIPITIKNHGALTHLLLQNNCLTSLPNELGTVSLKLLQINGNPLMYPPEEVVNSGQEKILKFLYKKHVDALLDQELDDSIHETKDETTGYNSYNDSVSNKMEIKNGLKVQLNEKGDGSYQKYYAKTKGKCYKLDKSRHVPIPVYCQSAKYLKPLLAEGKELREERLQRNYFRDVAIAKKKDRLAATEKILQGRRNIESLKTWRNNYRTSQFFNKNSSYRLDPKDFPYETSAEHMRFLTREDIEKDLPDKYRKNLVRRTRPSVPRKSNKDVHLALKIKQLFENLEALDLNRETMTPRTEQKMLMNEIHKITEIKQKLQELSSSNMKTVSEI